MDKTYVDLSNKYHWQNTCTDTKEFVESGELCQLVCSMSRIGPSFNTFQPESYNHSTFNLSYASDSNSIFKLFYAFRIFRSTVNICQAYQIFAKCLHNASFATILPMLYIYCIPYCIGLHLIYLGLFTI